MQAAPWLRARRYQRAFVPGTLRFPGFGGIFGPVDASAVVHTRSSSRRTPDPLTAGLFPQRSPPRLLTDAACGGLGSPPTRRTRRATPPSLAQHGSCRRASTSPSLSLQDTPQNDFWFPDIEIPVGFGQTRTAKQLPVLTMITGYSRWLSAVLIPSRSSPDLFAGWWQLIENLQAVPRVLVWDGEGAIGRWRAGKVELTQECHAFRGTLGAKVLDRALSRLGSPCSPMPTTPANSRPSSSGSAVTRCSCERAPGQERPLEIVRDRRRLVNGARILTPFRQVRTRLADRHQIDEVGYIPFEPEVANLVFQLVSSLAVAFEGDDFGVVDEAVDHGCGDDVVSEDFAQAAELFVAQPRDLLRRLLRASYPRWAIPVSLDAVEQRPGDLLATVFDRGDRRGPDERGQRRDNRIVGLLMALTDPTT